MPSPTTAANDDDDLVSHDIKKRGPGRPSLAEVAARERGAFKPDPAQPFKNSLLCPRCARLFEPKVLRTEGNCRTIQCVACNATFKTTYAPDGTPTKYEHLRGGPSIASLQAEIIERHRGTMRPQK